jgi:hypothetical protein
MMAIIQAIKRLFSKHDDLLRRVEQADHDSRETKHKLRNLAMRTQAIHKLFSEIKDDEVWRRGMNRGRHNDLADR